MKKDGRENAFGCGTYMVQWRNGVRM